MSVLCKNVVTFHIHSSKLMQVLTRLAKLHSHMYTLCLLDSTDYCIMQHANPFQQCLAAQIMTLLLMPLRHLPISVPRATCPGEFTVNIFYSV